LSRDPLFFLEDIEKSCSKVVRQTAGRDCDQVLTNELGFDGVLFNLHVIGEAVKNLPPELRPRYRTSAGGRLQACAISSPMPTSLSTSTSSGMRSSTTSLLY
jgi:hypothetical protein